MNNIKNVCVYSASSTKIAPVYFAVAEELGRLLASKGINLINGAGSIGLMGTTSNAALAAGGTVTGVIPRFMVEQNWHHNGLTQLIETETMHERKQLMAEMSDGVIALPGGCGTMEELLEMLQRAIDGNFMRPEHRAIWLVATSAQEAIDLLHTTPWWNKNVRKFAAI